MRRRTAQPPVSFFSFQDVMLSLIGITIVITIILFLQVTRQAVATLELASGGEPAGRPEGDRERSDLGDRMAVLEALIREAQRRPDQDPLARRTTLRAELQAAGARLESLESRAEELSRQLQELLLHSPAALEVMEAVQLLKERDKLVAELATIERRRRISYIIDPSQAELPYVMEISAGRIVLCELSADGVPYRPSGGTAEARIKGAFDLYLASSRGRRSYILFVVKPSGIADYMRCLAFIASIPEGARPRVGLDLIPENAYVSEVFPSLEGGDF